MAIANKDKELFFLRLVDSGILKVTTEGTVYNTVTQRFLGTSTTNPDYIRISYQDPASKTIWKIMAHRLVWIVHRGLIGHGLAVNHIDGNKHNNNLYNLEIVSDKANMEHARVTGLLARGSELSNSIRGSSAFKEHVERRKTAAKAARQIFESQSHRPSILNEGNSQWGTFWITDGSSNKKWSDKKGPLPEGFYRGRVTK